MIIDGKKIAEEVLESLTHSVEKLKAREINPTLEVIFLDHDPLSLSFIKQKQKKAESVGINVILLRLPPEATEGKIKEAIQKANLDLKIHGIILQLPLPSYLKNKTNNLIQAINPKKDIDGLGIKSPYQPAVARAVLRILNEIASQKTSSRNSSEKSFKNWLKNKKILIIGRGLTAGGPIIKTFQEMGFRFDEANSKTRGLKKLIKNSDIIISCVGKENLVTGKIIKKGSIVIDVGMNRNKKGELVGDAETSSVSRVASYYTPTPGGVGPLTVAFLLDNLYLSSSNLQKIK